MSLSFEFKERPKAREHREVDPDTYNEQLTEDEKDQKSARELRENLASKTFWFMCATTAFIGGLLGIYFWQHWCKDELIPESVIITLVTSTFATIVGLTVIILKGLFGSNK